MNRIFFLGDIHGDWRPIRNLNNRLEDKLDKKDTIVLLGDAGLNYYLNYRDEQFKKKLETFNCRFFVIRGNHEQRPSILADENYDKWDEDWYCINDIEGMMFVEKEFPFIFYAQDRPVMYHFRDHPTLVIPGAYSVDKDYRLMKGWSWFPEEQLSDVEKELGEVVVDIQKEFDLILSHTCPIMWEPTDLFLSMIDQTTVDKSMEKYLSRIEFAAQYKVWLWGHYHLYREYPMNYIGKPTYNNPRRIMLFNDYAVELEDLFNNKYCANKI